MLPVDHDIRKTILTQAGNIVISASAGTGKTQTTIERIKCDTEQNKGFMTFAAITFTRKAAQEILHRLGSSKGDGFVGTNDNFVWAEVVQPFMYDVFGAEFKKAINPDYSDGNQVKTFRDGVGRILDKSLMCKYADKFRNFAFELGLYILENSHSARRYIKTKYFRMYIDEYQDSDVDMHKFFMYICNKLEIPLFVVGDEKQSIYRFRGADSEGFKSLYDAPNFTKFVLMHNFRSVTAIQNYSNIFMKAVRGYYQPTAFNDEVIFFRYTNDDEACSYIDSWLDKGEKCAMLNFTRVTAQSWSRRLNGIGLYFQYVPESLLEYSDMESEHIWIGRGIANYILKHRYSEYDFRDDMPTPGDYKVSALKTKLQSICESQNDSKLFMTNCLSLYAMLGFADRNTKMEKEIATLFEVISDTQYVATYNQDKYRFTSGTIHSSKGLEFNQVIINASDYDFNADSRLQLHYVAITRPEERLLILCPAGPHCDRYMKYINTVVQKTVELGNDISVSDIIRIVE